MTSITSNNLIRRDFYKYRRKDKIFKASHDVSSLLKGLLKWLKTFQFDPYGRIKLKHHLHCCMKAF
jgi:hypothetical protein